jgi:hypothetical protein
MVRVLIELTIGTAFLIWGKWFADSNLQPELYGMAIGMGGALFIELVLFVIREWSFLRLYWDCYKPFTQLELRLSIAYLYKIEINGKYLLIKSNRIPNTFQPVGGVYKYFHPEAKSDLESFEIVTDNNIQNDDVSEFDLRLKLLNRRNIGKFLRWFFSNTERERDPWREFYEELVEPGILPASEFGYIHYEHIGQHVKPIFYDKLYKTRAFMYADIYTPKFINNVQLEEMKKLSTQAHPDYIWVTEEEILLGKSTSGQIIADHSSKIFQCKKLKQ